MYIFIILLGIIIGSFLNILVFPPSRCIHCSHPFLWYDKIPIVNYLSLRGKCRYCGEAISPQYPIVEILNGALYLFVFQHFGFSLGSIFYGFIASILIVICVIDYYSQIIPDGLVLMMLIAAIMYKTAAYMVYGVPLLLKDGLLGLLSGGLLLLAIAVISKGAMGGGDIKLIAVLGLILGLKLTILNILLSFVIGAVVSLYLLLSGQKGRKDVIPFGPFISIAFLITLFYGDIIINWYFRV